MHKDYIEKNWNLLKKRVQDRWNRFSESDIAHINGKYDLFLSHLQKKYSLSKEEAEQQIKEWHETHKKGDFVPRQIHGAELKPKEILRHKVLLEEDSDAVYPPNPKIDSKGQLPKQQPSHKKNEEGKRKAG